MYTNNSFAHWAHVLVVLLALAATLPPTTTTGPRFAADAHIIVLCS